MLAATCSFVPYRCSTFDVSYTMNPANSATISAQNTSPRLNPNSTAARITPSATHDPIASTGPMNEKSLPEKNTAAVSPPNAASVTIPACSGNSGLPPYFGSDAIVRMGTNSSV